MSILVVSIVNIKSIFRSSIFFQLKVICKIRNAKGEKGSSVVLRSYLKTWVKCGQIVTIGGEGVKKSPKTALRILRMTPFDY